VIATTLAAAFTAFAVDATTKRVARARLVEGRLYGHEAGWGLRLVRNARGNVSGLGIGRALALWSVLAVVAFRLPVSNGATAVGLGLVLGGVTGNLADRVLRGEVLDFVSMKWWPVFNLADGSMVAGLALVVAGLR
jgi:signal peptidase II